MGVAAAVVGTLAMGWLQGREQQRQMNAMAAQQEQAAQMAQDNADKMEKAAEQQAENNAINQENKRRQLLRQEGTLLARTAASGISMTGSALQTLADNRYAISQEMGFDAYNGKQKVTDMFNQSNEFYNQGNIHKANASNYRAAGKRAFMNSMLSSAFSLAGSLYSAKSSAAQGSSAGSAGFGDTAYSFSSGQMTYPNRVGPGWMQNTRDFIADGSSLGNVYHRDRTFKTQWSWIK